MWRVVRLDVTNTPKTQVLFIQAAAGPKIWLDSALDLVGLVTYDNNSDHKIVT